MTANLTELLELIDQLKVQHRAGITPLFGQQEALLELAAAVRSDVEAIACGLRPPAPVSVARGPVQFTAVLTDIAPIARAVIEALPASA